MQDEDVLSGDEGGDFVMGESTPPLVTSPQSTQLEDMTRQLEILSQRLTDAERQRDEGVERLLQLTQSERQLHDNAERLAQIARDQEELARNARDELSAVRDQIIERDARIRQNEEALGAMSVRKQQEIDR